MGVGMKILVTGATGLLGGRLVPYLRSEGLEIVSHGLTRPADIVGDLCDLRVAREIVGLVDPDTVVNLVCLANVDSCEKAPNLAYRLNVLALENLVDTLEARPSKRLIQISTDQVYDGPGLHREDKVVLRNVYALTKYAAELVARRARGTVLRTNFFGRSITPGKSSFSDWLTEAMRMGKPVTLFTDVWFSPLSMPTLCRMIAIVLKRQVEGIYNLGSHSGMNKCEFAYALAAHLGLSTAAAKVGTLSDIKLAAVRPTGMLMDSSQFERAFGATLPALVDEVRNAQE